MKDDGHGNDDHLNILPIIAKNSFRIIVKNGVKDIDINNLPKGLDILTPNEIKKYINQSIDNLKHQNDWALELNNKTNSDVFGIRVKTNNEVSLEIVIPEKINKLKASRFLFIVEESSNLNLLEVITGETCSAHSNISEMIIKENAIVNHGMIAISKGKSSLLAKRSVSQEVNSSYSFSFINQGWNLSRIEPEIVQVKGQADTDLRGLHIAQANQQLSTFSIIKFNGPNGNLNQLQKSMIEDNAHSIFNGIIEVPQVAQRTNAAQLSKNLLLTEKGQVDTKPELRIIADDVKCTHGATISELEEEEIFYLQSRGINSNEATKLIIKGYAKDILNQFPLSIQRWSHLSSIFNQ